MSSVVKKNARLIILSGQVQGVGFRPFIYRLAQQHNLEGWVRNAMGRVEIFVEGEQAAIDAFSQEIFTGHPPLAKPVLDSQHSASPENRGGFDILASHAQGEKHISVPVDLFLCDDCLRELNDPADRRYRYPFINCTQCGPRYTLIKQLPYDRANTTMAGFSLCTDCLAEYNDPGNRRFHAEPVACPVCGPALSLSIKGTIQAEKEAALAQTIELLQQGKTVAVKGIGGYHLMCDAINAEAVNRLRHNKPRPHKPLAVMFPAPADNPFTLIEPALALCDEDRDFLLQASRPILLLEKKHSGILCEQIAPGLNEVGLMLPYSPLHHLLLNTFGKPLVATSANISGEPVLTDNDEVEKRLQHVSDACLHHNRPIQRPADDPVYRRINNRPRPIRIGRGVAPLEIELPFQLPQPVLAVGAQMKNTVTLAWNNRAVISPHIGEMDTARSLVVFENTVNDLQALYAVKAETIICDRHPGYTTTRLARQWSRQQGLALAQVYHHHAHASAAFFECHSSEPVLVFSWDGTGYGEDSTVWGGETFYGRPGSWQRLASLRPFRLPGGDKAGRQPWRSAAALCWETGRDYLPAVSPADRRPEQMRLLQQAWQKKINSPQTSAMGRLFDAAAALCGICLDASFEGQGPMLLEAQCDKQHTDETIKLALETEGALLLADWEPLIDLMTDTERSLSDRATVFHHSLSRLILDQARVFRDIHGIQDIALSGGVFQNRILCESATTLLTAEGFKVCLPELIPVNDAGISFGQVIEYGFSN